MDGKILGRYIPRKVIYSFFLVVIVIIIVLLVLFTSFSQSLSVSNAEVSVIGQQAALAMTITNMSQHNVRGAAVIIDVGDSVLNEELPELGPGEDYNFYIEMPIPEDLVYRVTIGAPFNVPIRINFTIDESTIDPVSAEVTLSKTMEVGETYDVQVNLCNISQSPLPDVQWEEEIDGEYFQEQGLQRSVSLDLSQCKYLYLTLTPIKPGTTGIEFTLRVGSAEKEYSQELTIVEPSGDVNG
jgi:hypothetical protein